MTTLNRTTKSTTAPYTVVGFYSDNLQAFVHHVDATSAGDAKQKFTNDLPYLPMIAAVFEGHHAEALDDYRR